MSAGIWVRLVKKNRIIRSETAECAATDWQEGLGEVCRRLDLQRPLLLPKNEREWAEFGQTRFTAEHFFESIPFDRLEVEYINPDAPKKKSRDPRNEA